MAYCHLTNDERSQIYALLSIGATQKQIAVQLNKSRSTISREISRNSGEVTDLNKPKRKLMPGVMLQAASVKK